MKNAAMMKKNAPRFVDDTHVLVTKEFAKNARIFGTPEYKMWVFRGGLFLRFRVIK